ncbi:MAG: SixA phosphatase family protein [Bacteroidota bacterium]
MKLILLRHAKAQKASWEVPDDQRPLQKRGHAQIASLAEHLPNPLALDQSKPWVVWCSPALRTRQTLQEWHQIGQVHGLWAGFPAPLGPDWLYLADADRLESERQGLEDDTNLLVVGHNNGLSEWVDALLGYAYPMLRTCQLVVLQKRNLGEEGPCWRVEHSWVPDQEIW